MMGAVSDIIYEGRTSRFVLTPIERRTLHGYKRRIALDEQGRECASSLLTRDGRFLLPAGSTAESYLDRNGDVAKRSELAAMDTDGKPLATLVASVGRPQAVDGPIAIDEYLNHVATRVYALEAVVLDPALERALRAGAIFRVPFRPRATYAETPAFLLAGEQGLFLIQTEPCGFEFVGLEQTVSDADDGDEDDATLDDSDAFAFDVPWEMDYASA